MRNLNNTEEFIVMKQMLNFNKGAITNINKRIKTLKQGIDAKPNNTSAKSNNVNLYF